jgi:hypothetical protein
MKTKKISTEKHDFFMNKLPGSYVPLRDGRVITLDQLMWSVDITEIHGKEAAQKYLNDLPDLFDELYEKYN